jgi:hypothetical protein
MTTLADLQALAIEIRGATHDCYSIRDRDRRRAALDAVAARYSRLTRCAATFARGKASRSTRARRSYDEHEGVGGRSVAVRWWWRRRIVVSVSMLRWWCRRGHRSHGSPFVVAPVSRALGADFMVSPVGRQKHGYREAQFPVTISRSSFLP